MYFCFQMYLPATTHITAGCLMIRQFRFLQVPATSYLFDRLSCKFVFQFFAFLVCVYFYVNILIYIFCMIVDEIKNAIKI